MPLLLVVAFIVVPIVELFVIVRVGGLIGIVPTLALLLVVSVVGAWLVRREGTRAWRQFRARLGAGQPPTTEVVDGALVLVGGTLLLTPGFVTDALGFTLVFPPTRALFNRAVRRRARSSVRLFIGGSTARGLGGLGGLGGARPGTKPYQRGRPSAGAARPSDPEVVDAEVVDIRRDEDR